jgi:thiamine pyrophosphokinase
MTTTPRVELLPAVLPDVVVFAGGPPPVLDPVEVAWLRGLDAVLVAADRGLDHALSLGMTPTVVTGDLDSVSTRGLDVARTGGAEVVAHRADKDDTDLELALDLAAGIGSRLLVVGASG